MLCDSKIFIPAIQRPFWIEISSKQRHRFVKFIVKKCRVTPIPRRNSLQNNQGYSARTFKIRHNINIKHCRFFRPLIWGINAKRAQPIAFSKRYPTIKYFFIIRVGISADLLCPRRAPTTVCASNRHINRLFFSIGAFEKSFINVKQSQNFFAADPRIIYG